MTRAQGDVCRLPTFWMAALSVGLLLCTTNLQAGDSEEWPQAGGPEANWKVAGKAPESWSVVRNENIVWRTPMPEAGQSAVTVWKNRAFVTIHKPIDKFEDRFLGSDIVGYCLDAESGKVLWKIELAGTQTMELACGFSDATVFASVTDGHHVWFFNRCGAMGCYDFEGNEVWTRQYKLRFKHSNRQCEPILVDGQILNVEVHDKESGFQIRKFTPGTSKTIKPIVPDGVDEKDVWTYLHGIDAATGKILWRESVGTSVHNTPILGRLSDGGLAVAHARGGGHGPLEKPYGVSLTRVTGDARGETLWSTDFEKYDPSFGQHWSGDEVYGFHLGDHVVLSAQDGKLLRRQPLYKSASVWKRVGENWVHEEDVAVKAGKGHPNTNQANLVVGEWHWFLSHNVHYVGRVHVATGKVEYLEVPAQLIGSKVDRSKDELLWGKGRKNRPVNSSGFEIGRKGHDGTGWGHISAASPILVGHLLYCPVVTGTTYVIDTRVKELTPDALVAVNDLGPGGKTWTLASFSYSRGRLFMHTMREVICIGTSD